MTLDQWSLSPPPGWALASDLAVQVAQPWAPSPEMLARCPRAHAAMSPLRLAARHHHAELPPHTLMSRCTRTSLLPLVGVQPPSTPDPQLPSQTVPETSALLHLSPGGSFQVLGPETSHGMQKAFRGSCGLCLETSPEGSLSLSPPLPTWVWVVLAASTSQCLVVLGRAAGLSRAGSPASTGPVGSWAALPRPHIHPCLPWLCFSLYVNHDMHVGL